MIMYKEIFGYFGAIISLAGYFLYVRDIFTGKTKPHAFSWLVWGVLALVAFAAQVFEGAGAGSFVLGIDTVICFLIFSLAMYKGEIRYVLFDWVALVLAFFSIFLWWFTKTPTYSVVLVTCADVIGFMPTIRKAFYKPFEETLA